MINVPSCIFLIPKLVKCSSPTHLNMTPRIKDHKTPQMQNRRLSCSVPPVTDS